MANEMRDRLVELCENLILSCKASLCNDCEHNGIDYPHCMAVHFADHLIENGVIVPPCKVGDSCYPLPRYRTPIVERKISRITYSARNIIIGYYENDGQYRPPLRTRILGEDVFLTKSESEQKLKEMRGG